MRRGDDLREEEEETQREGGRLWDDFKESRKKRGRMDWMDECSG